MKIYGTENNEFLLKELGQRIRDTRIASRLSQKNLSDKTGLSVATIVRIEAGENTSVGNMLKILRALNLLQGLDVLIPEQELKPTELFDVGKKRQRVTEASKNKTSDATWEWGE